MESKIELRQMKFYAFHGVGEQERIVGNNFTVDVLLATSLEQAVRSDNLADTVDYAEVYSVVRQEMNVPSRLLEHVGGRILSALKHRFPQLESIEVKVSKQAPPFGGELQCASVILREEYNK
ncbi:MAG: dihydroneopterin aldolase [Tannerellaceae bacterium]|jgi:dihydroneopterin aldolase|nr:dihydroneopterin aldolase [Tannerellaceae bacterium]